MIDKDWIYRLVVMALILMQGSNVNAQLNLKVGYALGYSDLDKLDRIIDAYNTQYPSATIPLSQVHFHHGLEFGARYKFGNFGLDLGLMTTSGGSMAEGLPSSAGISMQELQSTHTYYYLGAENYLGTFGYGASVGYGRLRYKIDQAGVSEKQEVFNQNELSSRFYLLFEFPGKNIGFQFRPYVVYPISTFNLKELEEGIVSGSSIPAEELDQDIFIFGLSILFMNGPQ